jgi:cellulose synthase/poly-beta-1,6-N-acetylglucosamine synthase-like glycosyltransferase
VTTDIEELPDELSAGQLLSRGQAIAGLAILATVLGAEIVHAITGRGFSWTGWGQALVAVVTVVYVVVITFKLVLVYGAGSAPALRWTDAEVRGLPDELLPPYTVLVPLHREAEVLPDLLARLGRLEYPADRLQILLLIEDDDVETRHALDALVAAAAEGDGLGRQFEVVNVPPDGPRTKPKACNVGLARATGELCVIYDAEDRPDLDQLRKAVLAFRQEADRVVCVQAELQYWNPWTNWLTRCFAAEYATNFSLFLRGLDRHRLAIPLGGTSNHFRTDALRDLGGWDPYNVTEDADLGIRIARRGWDVRMMQSVTEEEANSQLGNWIRQRSRWIKGYMQTWLVHMRNPWRLWRELGTRRFLAFQLAVGFSTVTTLLNPWFWALTLVYLATGPDHIARFFPGWVLYLGVATMLLGNAMMVYTLMIGCMERGLHRAVRAMLSVPLYWALMSVAAYKALLQLLRPSRRHYWELTVHGLVPADLPAPT